ncbi:protein EXPORTIN 1A [Trifolium repens]|nr:protein EXPORTIN 1A [Trifolium repens]
MAAENLRDLSQPIDVSLLDATVAAFYVTGSKQVISASILSVLQNNADMGLHDMHILKSTQNLNTKFFALQMYDLRWSIRNAIYLKACYHAKAIVDLCSFIHILLGAVPLRGRHLNIETFLDMAEDQPQIGKQFVPPMMDPILGDCARNAPDARE